MASYSTGLWPDEAPRQSGERDDVPRASLEALRKYPRRTEGPGRKRPDWVETHVMGVTVRWNYNAGAGLYEAEPECGSLLTTHHGQK